MDHISKILETTVTPKNSAPATRETKKQEVGNPVFEAALRSGLIANSSIEELKQVLRLVMIKVGLRAANWPVDEEKQVLLEHIVSNYGGNSVGEVKLAFEMAITGKLDLTANEVNPYENFSCAYFSTIMDAYRAWSAQEYKQAIKPEMMEQKILTDEQLENIHREDIENFYQRLRGGWIPDKMPKYFEERLQKDGLLKECENLNDFFVRKLGANAECLYRKDI